MKICAGLRPQVALLSARVKAKNDDKVILGSTRRERLEVGKGQRLRDLGEMVGIGVIWDGEFDGGVGFL